MHFYNIIQNLVKEEKYVMFVDMDGVIASYDFGRPLDFSHKRPLTSNIKVLERISHLDNIELCILSICRRDAEIDDKNNWLNQNAPFFSKDNRFILSRESNDNIPSKEIKLNFLTQYKTNKGIIFVDDDNEVLKIIHSHLNNILLFQDSELVD